MYATVVFIDLFYVIYKFNEFSSVAAWCCYLQKWRSPVCFF